MSFLNRICGVLLLAALCGCGDEAPRPGTKAVDWDAILARAEQRKAIDAQRRGVSFGGVEIQLSPQHPGPGSCLTAEVSGAPVNDIVRWDLNGRTVQLGENRRFCLTGGRKGDVITASIGDANGGAATSLTVVNTPPRILGAAVTLVTEAGETYIELTAQVEDPDEDFVSLSYQWMVNDQEVESLSGNRLPAAAYRPGDRVRARLVADDGTVLSAPYDTDEFQAPGAAPVIISTPVTEFKSLSYAYQVVATDPDGGGVAYRLDQGPEGMHIDGASGLISWPLQGVQPGQYKVVVVVADVDGDENRQEFQVVLGRQE